MKKLLTILSITFAFLAGFNACGSIKTQTDNDVSDNETEDADDSGNTGNTGNTGNSGNTGDTDDPGDTGDTFYGIAYCEFKKIV
jgi:hypothetical protein